MASSQFSQFETRLMRQLLKLAARFDGVTRPNPMVAAAVIQNGRVIAKAAHTRAGKPHAEVLALQNAGALAKGATLMVTLEPCTHIGRTPPCCDAIVHAGIREVIFAVRDPNPLVRHTGGAEAVLTQAGIRVRSGLLKEEAARLNAVFFKAMTQKMPFVTLKIAQSLDGKIALGNGQSKYLTSLPAQKAVHRMRRSADAILIGHGTLTADDPGLDVRFNLLPRHLSPPAKVVLTSTGDVPMSSKIFATPGLVYLVIDQDYHTAALQKKWVGKAVLIPVQKKGGYLDLHETLSKLFQNGIRHCLIEGGTRLASSAIQARAVDRLSVFIAPKLLMGPRDKVSLIGPALSSLNDALTLSNVTITPFLPDVLVSGDLSFVL